MSVTDMPADILCDIMRVAGQSARVQSLLACKALHAAASAPGTWSAVDFADLDCTAVDFMVRHRCAAVHIVSSAPDDVSWFMHRLADIGCDSCIRELRVDIASVQRLPEDLLCGVARHRELRTLAVFVDDLEQTCEVHFPRTAQMLHLHTLRIVEASPDSRQLVVWFDGSQSRFPALRSMELDVGLSDVMAGLCHFPRLRRLVYRCDDDEGGETYEDVNMVGCDLDELQLDVGVDVDMRRLCRQLERSSVRRLVLHVNDDLLDLSRKLSPALERLELSMCTTHADVEIDFPNLRQHEHLRLLEVYVGAPWIQTDPTLVASCHHCLTFQHADVSEWIALMHSRVHLALLSSTRVCVSPS